MIQSIYIYIYMYTHMFNEGMLQRVGATRHHQSHSLCTNHEQAFTPAKLYEAGKCRALSL